MHRRRGQLGFAASVLLRAFDRTRERLRYTNEDGTLTLWGALVNFVAPVLMVIGLAVDAIVTQ